MRLVKVLLCLSALLGCAAGDLKPGPSAKDGGAHGYPAARYMSATGIGQSEGEARNQAVAELSRIFESKVRSDTLDRVRVVAKSGGEETSEQAIDSRIRVISDVDLKGLEIASTWKKDGNYYALAVLERFKARDNWLREISGMDRDIEGRLKALDGLRSRLLKYRSLRTVSDLWLRREVIQSRLTVLGFRAGEYPGYDIKEVFRAIPAIKTSMPVFLDIEGADAGPVIERIGETLGQAGFVITGDRQEAAVLIKGRVGVEPVEISHPDWKYARATVALSVMDVDEGVSIGEVAEYKRSSHLSYPEAAKKAVNRVLPAIARKLLDYMEEGG